MGLMQSQLSLQRFMQPGYLASQVARTSSRRASAVCSSGGVVDHLQVIGEGLFVLVCHVFQRVAHHMNDAPLVFRQRIRRRYGFLDAAQSVRTDHENVLYAAVFQLVQHAQPEFRALILTDGDAQDFLPPFLVDAEYHVGRRLALSDIYFSSL